MSNKLLHWLAGVVLGIAVSAPAPAGWVNDWITQKTVSGPNYTNIQGQSLMSFGGFNARWQRGSGPTPLLSFERPSFRVGCGGIDAKMGGFWFAGIDALVQKVQAIIQNAAAIMFKIALDTISQMLGGAAEWVENVVRAVNSIAKDECTAARSLVNAIDPGGAGIKSTAHSLMDSLGLAELSQSLGVSPSAPKAGQKMKDTDTAPTTQDTARLQCPSEVQQLLPINGQGSVLKEVMTSASLVNWENVARGMVGDVVIQKNTNKGGDTFVAQTVPSCYENKDLSFDNMLDGNLKQRPVNGACTPDAAPGGGLLTDITTVMNAIVAKYKTGTALSSSEQQFLNELPLAIAYRLQGAALSDSGPAGIDDIAHLTATAYAYQSLEDLYRVTRKAAVQYNEKLRQNENKMSQCKIAAVEEAGKALKEWSRSMYKRVMGLRKYYSLRVAEFNAGTQLTGDALKYRLHVRENFKERVPKAAAKNSK